MPAETAAALGDVSLLSKGPTGPHPATAGKAAFLSWRGYGLDSSACSSSGGSSGSPGRPVRAGLGSFWSKGAAADGGGGASGGLDAGSTANPADAAALRPSSPLLMHWGGVRQQQQQQSPGKALKGGEKYPGFLEVTVAAKPRPAPEVLMVVTDPAAGVRPDVPAGYGSGFEHGELGLQSS